MASNDVEYDKTLLTTALQMQTEKVKSGGFPVPTLNKMIPVSRNEYEKVKAAAAAYDSVVIMVDQNEYLAMKKKADAYRAVNF